MFLTQSRIKNYYQAKKYNLGVKLASHRLSHKNTITQKHIALITYHVSYPTIQIL
jgi:hypothetical protein